MREYGLVLLTAFATTYLLAGLCRRLALRVGAVAKPRERDVHAVPIPYFGGIAMLGGVGAALLLAAQLPFLGKHAVVTHDSAAIFMAGVVICAVGVLDDMLDLPALAKTAGQVLAAGVVVLNGVRMFWIALPNRIIVLDTASSILITVIFIFLSLLVYVVMGTAPAAILVFVGGFNGLILPIGLSIFTYVGFARPDLMGGHRYNRPLLIASAVVCALTWYMGWKSVGTIFAFLNA